MVQMIADWPGLRSLALSLNLPGVEETTAWGNPLHQGIWQDVVRVVTLCRCCRLQGRQGRTRDADFG
jgi:hypothetical protein